MSSTYRDAINEIYRTFNDAWNADSASIVSYIPEIYWQGVQRNPTPPSDLYYVRFNNKNIKESQKTLQTSVGAVGKIRYNNVGMLFVNIFTPLSDEQHMDRGRSLSEIAKLAYRGKTSPSGVIFRNVTTDEFDHSDIFFNFRVTAEYDYDDIG